MVNNLNYLPQKAMVFAAGLGTRMRPITDGIPKPMVKVKGKPLIDYRLDKLAEAGVKTAIVNTFYLPEIIEDHLKNRKNPEIIISRENTLLETGGGIKNAMNFLGNLPFFTINSDIIWVDKGEQALLRLAHNWNPNKMDALLLLHEVDKAIGYIGNGDFDLSENNELMRSQVDKLKHKYVFTGIQILNPALLDGYEEKVFSLSDVYRKSYNERTGRLNRIYGIIHHGDWLHIDSEKSLAQAEDYFTK